METGYKDIISFHGHSCPGLAIGYRLSKAGLNFLAGSRSEDEELVAIVENDACGVDALQYTTGCTFGKGNLIFKDYGKQVYTLYDRNSRKGVRVSLKPFTDLPENARADREQFINWLLTAPEKDVVYVKEVVIDEPEPARIMKSVTCSVCKEGVMESRTVTIDGKVMCIPCSERIHT